jgi:hypothetical protein
MGEEYGVLQILQGGIIKTKLALQHPVADATAALQHGESLIEQLFKRHIASRFLA